MCQKPVDMAYMLFLLVILGKRSRGSDFAQH